MVSTAFEVGRLRPVSGEGAVEDRAARVAGGWRCRDQPGDGRVLAQPTVAQRAAQAVEIDAPDQPLALVENQAGAGAVAVSC